MPLTDISHVWLQENYVKEKLSIKECARKLNLCPAVIHYAIRKNNIEPHPKSVSGADHPAWKGGISYLPYCHKFNKSLKEQVREAFGRKCYLCGANENGKGLDVHHCDFNKQQGCKSDKGWKLVPLCKSCHAKTTFNRHWAFNKLANYWADKYIQDGINI